jgi:membrane fusion protein, copper/silver efflux system
MKKILILVVIVAAIAFTGWTVWKKDSASTAAEEARKPLYYQCAMHPQVKSDKPGRCTICGMELTPIYASTASPSDQDASVLMLRPDQEKIIGISTSQVEMKPLHRHLRVAGMIDDDESRHRLISAYVAGRVDKLNVNFLGAEVTEGQPLADFYSTSLLQAEREYRQLSGDLKQAAATRLRQMGLTDAQIQALPEKPADALDTQILAPMTGTVVARHVYEGQYVMEGEKLFEIADFSTMWYLFAAYENDLPWLKEGQTVEVSLPSIPGKTFKGAIKFIDPNLDENTRSAKVRVELPNPVIDGKRQFFHRPYAEGQVEVTTNPVLVVPRQAVIQTGTEALVYVTKEASSYEQRLVTIGRRGDEEIEIISGLKAGERVVTNGNVLVDAQIELTHGRPMAAQTQEVTAELKSSLIALVPVADQMSKALAASDLAGFKKSAAESSKLTVDLLKALPNNPKWQSARDALSSVPKWEEMADLRAARTEFHRVAKPLAELLGAFSKTEGVPAFQIWKCQMAGKTIGLPKEDGWWIELNERECQNPYFGEAMLDCGEKVQLKQSHD